jgi:hypothetical protein
LLSFLAFPLCSKLCIGKLHRCAWPPSDGFECWNYWRGRLRFSCSISTIPLCNMAASNPFSATQGRGDIAIWKTHLRPVSVLWPPYVLFMPLLPWHRGDVLWLSRARSLISAAFEQTTVEVDGMRRSEWCFPCCNCLEHNDSSCPIRPLIPPQRRSASLLWSCPG